MTVEAYAKVNLTLAVLGERSDGYHALRSLVVPISLNDTIDLESRENAGSANFPSGSQGDLCGTDNLCFKAARALVGARGLDMRLLDGLSMRLTKRIPVGGGLGGGSADAAAVLVALNRLWGLGLSRRELADIGAQVGSDVPALVLGGPVLMEGRGEIVTPIQLPNPLDLVVVDPGVFSSTKEVYERLGRGKEGGEASEAAKRRGDAPDACFDVSTSEGRFFNDLEKPAVELHPEIGVAMERLRSAGGRSVTMSGSGACVFCLSSDADDAHRLAAEMSGRGYRAWAVRTIGQNMV